jgi:hypothetical protein
MTESSRWSVNADVMVFIDARWTDHRYRPQRFLPQRRLVRFVGAADSLDEAYRAAVHGVGER